MAVAQMAAGTRPAADAKADHKAKADPKTKADTKAHADPKALAKARKTAGDRSDCDERRRVLMAFDRSLTPGGKTFEQGNPKKVPAELMPHTKQERERERETICSQNTSRRTATMAKLYSQCQKQRSVPGKAKTAGGGCSMKSCCGLCAAGTSNGAKKWRRR